MNRLFIPTCSGFKDMLRSSITDQNAKTVIFNPGCDDFVLVERLITFSNVYGIIMDDVGVFALLKVIEQDGKLIIISEYFNKVINIMLNKSFNQYGERNKYYVDETYINTEYRFSKDNFFSDLDGFDDKVFCD